MTFELSSDLGFTGDSIRGRLAMVNRWLEDEPDWQTLADSGSTNQLFRGRSRGRNLVLRLNATERYAFGVDRCREATVLALISVYDWAPQLLYNDWQQGWCLMEDHGHACVNSGLTVSVEPLAALLEAIGQWQQLNVERTELSICRLDYSVLSDRYRSAFGSTPDRVWMQMLHRFDEIYRSLAVVPECLTHHDLHPGNLCGENLCSEALAQIESDSRWRVLDWEYAAVANPWFDAAALHRKFGVEKELIAGLPAFLQLSRAQFERCLDNACWLSEALECLWYAVRSPVEGAVQHRQTAQKLLLIPLSSGVGR
ncbi:MAG: phosphotransferase [Motiliproteus sp.]